MSGLADIIAQETADGRLVVRFLVSAMDGQLPDFLPCHRIDAARLLVKLGFDHAQAVIDRDRARQREPRSRPHAQRQSESETAAHRVRSELAQIVREETDDGRTAVRFLVNVMQGELPDFKPCHRLSAARELLQRGFDYVPDHAEPEPEPEPDPAEVEAQRRRAEHIEFSRHGHVYYQSYPYPCVCEDRLHDCKGNVLDDRQREKAARSAPAKQYFITDPDGMDRFLARYADYLTRRNAENPDNPIEFDRIIWNCPRWQNRNPVRGP